MIKQNETKKLELEKLQLIKEQSSQLQEGIVSNFILIYDVVIKLLLLLYGIIIITQIFSKE